MSSYPPPPPPPPPPPAIRLLLVIDTAVETTIAGPPACPAEPAPVPDPAEPPPPPAPRMTPLLTRDTPPGKDPLMVSAYPAVVVE